MEQRERRIVGAIWLAVAVLAVVAVDLGELSVATVAGVGAAVLALWLAVLYLLDPWGLLDRYHP